MSQSAQSREHSGTSGDPIVLGITPAELPDARMAATLSNAGALGVLDLTRGGPRAREALADVRRWTTRPFGVRLGRAPGPGPADVRDAALVVLAAGAPWQPSDFAAGQRVLAEVTGLADAREAVHAGAHGLIARGDESGGRVAEQSTFVLLQQLLADPDCARAPVWACGGIGPRTAAAAVMGGATGVVLDIQLALLDESDLPEPVARAIRATDGTDSERVAGHRVLRAVPAPGRSLAGLSEAELIRRLGSDDTAEALLPVGQDGFLADRFAREYGDVRTAVRAVRDAMGVPPLERSREWGSDTVTNPQLTDVLLGTPLGTALPVAQGPMTRVSDRPEFAAAVARDGGLPFVALALSDGAASRDLLTRTRDALNGLPWGAGILGFVPEELRAAQLTAIREVRPSHVIIAGGRPSQAAALEAEGISTFLHVPSPVLLRQYLRAGARKFVFEGAECGGHVGPRNSFPLWEAQTEVLTAFLDTDDGDSAGTDTAARATVLFAGGVHDERSAAMVAALAAPLAARGVGTGLLMGTAYLFTEEAVELGAVGPAFQRQVVTATATDLLETAPGHATRCVRSPFTEEFARVRAERRAQGAPEREIWAELEALNVGRLRLAAKGVERSGDRLVTADEERQRADGLFMAGQVATLRDRVTSVAALHRAVTSGAAEFAAVRLREIGRAAGVPVADDAETVSTAAAGSGAAPSGGPAERAVPASGTRRRRAGDVAIVGMACLFPDAPDLESYWSHVVTATDAVREVSPERWDPDIYFDADGEPGRATVSKWGGFLPRIPFDPLRYGIPPTALASIEPVQLLALEVARRALDDAFGTRDFARERTSVVFGAEAGSDLANATVLRAALPAYYGSLPEALDGELPRLTADSFPGMLANVISGRIANRLDLGGANYIVDAACASSLAALDIARKELVGGSSDVVLCGGADLHNGIGDYLLFSSVHALSPTGRSRPFDHEADGIGLGEGVACLVLKRLADAERDGDRIYAVLKGVGAASDGKSLGLTAPRREGQRAALDRAYADAGLSPSTVGLVEAHGTGTVVGDRTELAALTDAFTEAGARPGSCALGSVKALIGHTKCAAGLAGLVKAAMALHTGVLPPAGNIDRPNPAWSAETSPFSFAGTARPWTAPPAERVAGVSAFGFGGTNFHAVLTAHPSAPPRSGLPEWPAELLLFHGSDLAAARRDAARLLELAEADDRAARSRPLRDLAATAAALAAPRAARREPVRIALLCDDLDDLTALLRRALSEDTSDPSAGLHIRDEETAAALGESGRVAFLFPGQGSQTPGMFAELTTAFPQLRRYVDEGARWAAAMFPPDAFDEPARAARFAALTDTRVAQPALGIAGLVAHDLLALAGVRPDMAAGHSYGELVALCVSGAYGTDALLRLSEARASAIHDAAADSSGTMAAVSLGAARTAAFLAEEGLADQVVVANVNTPRQTVISGPVAAVDSAVERFRAAGHGAKRIPVACAFHSPAVAGAASRFAPALAAEQVGDPAFPVFANRTTLPYSPDPDLIRRELTEQIAAPVRFAEQIEAMYEAGARVFVETGPGTVLTRFTATILGDRPHLAVAVRPGGAAGELHGYLDMLARLAVAGVPVRLDPLFRGRAAPVDTDEPPARAGWLVDGHLVRTADGDPLPGGLRPARRIMEPSVTQPHGGNTPAEQLVADFLRAGRDLLSAQRDVLLGYFGTMTGTPAAPIAPIAPAAPPIPALPSALPIPTPAPAPTPVPALTAPLASPPPATVVDTASVVREVISERTGYPPEMVEADLDLEADLSIDSIKRMEIAAELVARVTPVGVDADSVDLEDLSRARTASAIEAWLTEHVVPAASPASVSPAPASPDHAAVAEGVPSAGERPGRYRWCSVPLEDVTYDGATLAGRTVLLLRGDGGVEALAAALRERLTECGAAVESGQDRAGDGHVGVFCLAPVDDPAQPLLPEMFPLIQRALTGGARFLVVVAPATGADPDDTAARTSAAEGLRGLLRTAAREFPEATIKLVETDELMAPDGSADAAAVARRLLAEALTHDHQPVVRHLGGRRLGLGTVPAGLGPLATAGAGPADDGTAEARALGLDTESVVLVIGGGRGITAQVSAALATASRCRLVLAGRTDLPNEPEGPETAAARTLHELRSAFVARGDTPIRDMEKAIREILAQRELTGTLAAVEQAGAAADYRILDVLDPVAVRRLVKEVHQQYGRLDGIVYGAGVTVDQLVARTTMESFRLVYDSKVAGASALLDAAAQLPVPPRFVVLFGSVATVIGSRGQVGYAAANDVLESLAHDWTRRTGTRGVTVHWGPWAPVGAHPGMVSEELQRDFTRRELALIDPEEGPMCLLRELAWYDGPPADATTVIYAPSGWLDS